MAVAYTPTVEERVRMHLEDGTYTLLFCPNAWALQRRVYDRNTGEERKVRCGLWTCLYCGPRKVNEWRQLIAAAEPTLHIMLSKAGKTVEEAARALTTFMQALRRGSKGRGRSRVGARPAYPIEYLAVLEEHADFEENGFHWHILAKGVDHIPYKEVVQPLWESARHGVARNGWVRRIDNTRAIGYVTKYLMKDVVRARRGVRVVERRVMSLWMGEDGKYVEEAQIIREEMKSQARRIRYSRHFFPESTKELRKRLFTPSGEEESEDTSDQDTEQPEGNTVQAASSWELREVGAKIRGTRDYQNRLRRRLREEIEDRAMSGKRLSRRVVTLWNYQRSLMGAASE